MKKIFYLLIGLLVVFSILTGCGTSVDTNQSTSTPGETEQEINNDLQLEEIADNTGLPQEITADFEVLKKHKGYKLYQNEEGEYILFISLGEKTSGGYDIVGKEIKKENGNINVYIEEIEPDGMAATVMTYPYKVFGLKGSIEDSSTIQVISNTTETFKEIKSNNETNEDGLKKNEGIFQGRMDPHSVEILVDGEPKGFQTELVNDVIEEQQITEGDNVEFTYEENQYGQLNLKSINKK